MLKYLLIFLLLLFQISDVLLSQEKGNSKPAVGSIREDKALIKNEFKRWREYRSNKLLIDKTTIPTTVSAEPKQPIIIDEGFEGSLFPPTGWTAVIVSGSPNWIRDQTSPYTGIAAAYSEFGPAGTMSSRYLITKRISVVNTYQYRLSFWVKREFLDVYDPDTIYVRISNTDSLPLSFSTVFYKCYTGIASDTITNPNIYTTNYRKLTTTFTGYSGNVWIAFDHQDEDGQGIHLDGVKLEEIVNNDIGPSAITNPINASRKNYNEAFTPRAVFKNFGLQTQTNIQVLFQVISPNQTIIYADNKSISTLNPNSEYEVNFSNFTPYMYGTHKARAVSKHTGDLNSTNDTMEIEFKVPFNLSGTRTIGSGGDHANINNALQYLMENNVAGALTFLLTNTTYNEPPLNIGSIYYTSFPQPVEIRPALGISATINISASYLNRYGIQLDGTKNFTFDGWNGAASSNKRNLIINLDTAGAYAPAVYINNGCDNVTLKNFTAKGYSKSDMSSNTVIVIDSLGENKNITFDNLHLMRGFNGYFFNTPQVKAKNINIKNCDFGGEGIDAIGQAGIVAYQVDSLNIAFNNIKKINNNGPITVYGIYLGGGCSYSIINSNFIHHIENTQNGYNAFGITNNAGANSNLLCYNNMLFAIQSTAPGTEQNLSVGIYSTNPLNYNDKFYYNSVYLSTSDSSTHQYSHSSGFKFESGVQNFTALNNIVYNNSTTAGGSGFNKAYAVYVSDAAWPSGAISNYNDLYCPSSQGSVGFINSVNRYSLVDWKNFTGQDANSISADPLFIGNENLHVQYIGVSSAVNSNATPIPNIDKDIDGETRNISTPDIGADEFTPQSGATGSVNAGWNMVSLPVIVADPRAKSVFPTSSSSAFTYSNGYMPKDTLVTGVGYWLKFPSQQSVNTEGQLRIADTVNIAQGWNMVGSLSIPISKSSLVTIPPGIINSPFYGYNNGYQTADTLKPFKSYWIKSTQAGELIFNTP